LAQAARLAEQQAKDQARAARLAETAADKARREATQKGEEAEAQQQKAEVSLYFNRVALANRYWLAGNVDRAQELLDLCPIALRGWEWNYLKRLMRAELLTLTPQSGPVYALAVSPDGKGLATAGGNESGDFGVVKVWDLATGQALLSFAGHRGAIL